MSDDIQTADVKFATVTNDGVTTHIARVTFPGNDVVVGVGDTPELAMQDAFVQGMGAKGFSYGPGYQWNKPAWLSETGDDEDDDPDLGPDLGDHDAARSH